MLNKRKKIKEIAKELAISFFFASFIIFIVFIFALKKIDPIMLKINNLFTVGYVESNNRKDIKIDKIKKRLTSYPHYGDAFGSIVIPSVGIDITLYQGERLEVLKYGAGHHAGSFFPGEGGTIIIAAHNNYGQFYTLPEVEIGAEVIIKTDYGVYHYKITRTEIANATVLGENLKLTTDIENIMLYTCYPLTPGYKSDRFVAYGELVSEEHD